MSDSSVYILVSIDTIKNSKYKRVSSIINKLSPDLKVGENIYTTIITIYKQEKKTFTDLYSNSSCDALSSHTLGKK